MAYWLFKSEPSSWSWDDMQQAAEKGTEWDGVRNYQARNFMRTMKPGDLGLFYHSVDEKRSVGIVKVIREVHPDSTDDSGTWECVDISAVEPLPVPVSLDQCKSDQRLAGMVLVNNSRLSVQPVSELEWNVVCELAGLKKRVPKTG